jgi:flagellar protein FliS
MEPTARQAYLETQILTATPQRLRLMLVEGAIRSARGAQMAWSDGDTAASLEAIGKCRDILSELIAGIQPEQSRLARDVLGIYMFLFSTLVEAQFGRDVGRLNDVIRVLEEERMTWQAVCEQMPERPPVAPAAEEVAPQRVEEAWAASYVPAPLSNRRNDAASAFSIEA